MSWYVVLGSVRQPMSFGLRLLFLPIVTPGLHNQTAPYLGWAGIPPGRGRRARDGRRAKPHRLPYMAYDTWRMPMCDLWGLLPEREVETVAERAAQRSSCPIYDGSFSVVVSVGLV